MNDDIIDILEENICKALSPTGVNVIPNGLHACLWIKRSDRATAKFKCHKQKNYIVYKHKNHGNKSQEHTNLKFSRRLSVGESISHKNQNLE